MFEDVQAKIEEWLAPWLLELNVELVDLTIKRAGRTVMIEVLVDRAQGGITIAQCTTINKRLSANLEIENLIADDYMLEVSSPGLDRPLKNRKDFLRILGKPVRVHLVEPVAQKLEHSGLLANVEADDILVQVKEGLIRIPLEKITKAVQVI